MEGTRGFEKAELLGAAHDVLRFLLSALSFHSWSDYPPARLSQATRDFEPGRTPRWCVEPRYPAEKGPSLNETSPLTNKITGPVQ